MIPLMECALELLLAALPVVQQGATSRATVSSEGRQGSGFYLFPLSRSVSISGDGTVVAFETEENNLVPGDDDFSVDIIAHSFLSGKTVRASVNSNGTPANEECYQPAVSGNGRYVAFVSRADNLVGSDSNGFPDVFVHDLITSETVRLSLSSLGVEADGGSSSPSISDDGMLVTFTSAATNLVPGDTNGVKDAFVHDRINHQTTRISLSSSGAEANGASYRPVISGDGRFVAFTSGATNLSAGDTNGFPDAYLRDRTAGVTERISFGISGQEPNEVCTVTGLSTDGRHVAFDSPASNSVAGDTNGSIDVFICDRQLGTNQRASVDSYGNEVHQPCSDSSLSDGGTLVAFISYDSHLVDGDTNDTGDVVGADVFVHNTISGETVRASVNSEGFEGNDGSGWYWWDDGEGGIPMIYGCAIAGDGSSVVFGSGATNLVPYDKNGVPDYFRRELDGCNSTIATYCVSSQTSIPGCVASIEGVGTPSLGSTGSFVVQATNVPGGGNFGIAYFGVSGPAQVAFGSQGGAICVSQPFRRSLPHPSGGSGGHCDGAYSFTLQDLIDVAAGAILPGATVHAAVWFRDPPSNDHFGLSNGVWFVVCP